MQIETDKVFRKELIKRHALGSIIHDESAPGTDQSSPLPFKFSKDDSTFQKAYEIKALQKLALTDVLGDLEGLGIEFGPEDFVDQKKLQENQDAQDFIQGNKYFKSYLDKKGGVLKCLPLSYIQSNFATYYSARDEFVDQTIGDVKSLSENYASILGYSSGEDEEYKEK